MMQLDSYLTEYLSDYKNYKDYWNYEDGCIIVGCIDMYRATGEEKYRDFVLKYVDANVQPDGSIPRFNMKQYATDNINPGKALFFALDETGDEKYQKAIEFHMTRISQHPRCDCGNFWHKENYPYQVWLDGLYMVQPFYMMYEKRFDHNAHLQDIISQFRNVRKYLFDDAKQLYYHAWDERKVQKWANPNTGCSPNFWLRSMGWYLMSLIDCIEYCDEQLFEHRKYLIDLFREAVRGILDYMDKDHKLFYQVIDHPEYPGNYLESSGSAMIAYSLLKGSRLRVLNPEKYAVVGKAVMEHLVQEKLVTDDQGEQHFSGICRVAGLGPGEKRDGSIGYYLSEEICSDDAKGVGPLMMAYSEYCMEEK